MTGSERGSPDLGELDAELSTIRVAAVQAASVFLDRAASTAKACDLIREAGRGGAQLVVFPEGFIPAHPGWFHVFPATHPKASQLAVELFRNAVEVEGPEVAQLARAARDARTYVVIGVCERLPGTDGTMYNSQIYLGPDGDVVGKHQKLTPTSGERLVHAGGYGDTLGTFPTPMGRVGALICGENSNPLAVFALAADHPRVHAMSWPNFIAPSAPPLPERVRIASLAFAAMARCYVVSAVSVVDDTMIDRIGAPAEYDTFLRDPTITGGSIVVAPNGSVVAGPLGAEEAILYADLDLEVAIRAKLSVDYAGHYNRADVFQLQVNNVAPRLIRRIVDDGDSPAGRDVHFPDVGGTGVVTAHGNAERDSPNGVET